MKKLIAAIFVGPRNLHMSGLVASKVVNLDPIPDEVVFITPDVNVLKHIHHNQLRLPMTIRYISDAEACEIVGLNIQKLNWLTRQWIELHLDVLFPQYQYILTLDSDIVINRSLTLIENDKINLFIESEYYEPYFKTMRTLLPDLKTFLPHGDSFIADMMVLVPKELSALRTAMNVSFDDWEKLCRIDNLKVPAFSEYETIGTWMLNYRPESINLIKSDIYHDANFYAYKKYKLSDILKIKSVVPLRVVFDTDIDWYE